MLAFLYRVCSSAVFLSVITFTIPLAFDVGGRTCGLAFSLSIATFYALLSTLKLATPKESTFRRGLVRFISAFQLLVIGTLMIWCLNKFSVDSAAETSTKASWVARTFNRKRVEHETISQWLVGEDGLVASATIGSWDKLLRWSVPVFQLVEGFCSLLVIQAAGQTTRWLVNRDGGDNWMIGLLVLSASIISTAVYFVYRITTFPDLGNVDALLIGVTITCAIFLCAWGIGSGRGNPVESSLLFAYVTLCIYQIFTDYQPSGTANDSTTGLPLQPEFPPLPPIIMASYSTLTQLLSSLPSTFISSFNFFVAAFMTVTPSVIISLAYRVFVMYAGTRIVPAIRDSGANGFIADSSPEDADGLHQLIGLASWYSPSILVAVYTSLLMQHFSSMGGNGASTEWWSSLGEDAGGNIWRWGNLAATMLLYAVELYIGYGQDDGLTSHWKVD